MATPPPTMRSKSVTSLHDLPEPILDDIFRCLRIPDLHNLRLSGALAPCPRSCKQLREVFLGRVRDLQEMCSLMDFVHAHETFTKHLPPGWEFRFGSTIQPDRPIIPVQLGRLLKFKKSRAISSQVPAAGNATIPSILVRQFPLSPVDVVQNLDCLAIPEIPTCAARTILREFPEIKQLSVMPDYLSAVHIYAATAPVISNLPEMSDEVLSLIRNMSHLRYLMLERQNMARLPDFFLSRFNELEELYICYNSRITELPPDIGLWLPQLRVFGMKGIRISSIPQSLVHVLVENCAFGLDAEGLRVTRSCMPEEVLERELSADRFPEAAARFAAEAQNPVLWWRDTIVYEFNR